MGLHSHSPTPLSERGGCSACAHYDEDAWALCLSPTFKAQASKGKIHVAQSKLCVPYTEEGAALAQS